MNLSFIHFSSNTMFMSHEIDARVQNRGWKCGGRSQNANTSEQDYNIYSDTEYIFIYIYIHTQSTFEALKM